MTNHSALAADSGPAPETQPKTQWRRTLDFLGQLILLFMVIAPVCLAFYAAAQFTRGEVSWKWPVAAFLAASLTNFGTTAGFHRMLAHQSFRAHPAAQYVLLILGTVAGMGSPVYWAHNHIHHHSHSDTENDIHSPHTPRFAAWPFEMLWQFLDAHTGWLFHHAPVKVSARARQVTDTPAAQFVHRTAPQWFFAGLVLPLCFGWNAFLWMGVVRVFLSQHISFSVNSICHMWGQQPFKNTKDRSKNNVLVGLLALGEGWHNNHHFRPVSARHGLLPGQIDLTYGLICLLERCGLASHVQRYAPCPQCRDWFLTEANRGESCARCRITA